MNEQDAMFDMARVHLNFSHEEMEVFKKNPRNLEVLNKFPDLLNTIFTAEVIEAGGCACQHQVGQKIIISGDGSLLAAQCPDRVCVYLLQALGPIIYSAQEFIYAGIDPNQMKFKEVGCLDVGLKCGGIGHVGVAFSSKNQSEE
jgi:uncharacterized repeat protein (TIGR04076 family)